MSKMILSQIQQLDDHFAKDTEKDFTNTEAFFKNRFIAKQAANGHLLATDVMKEESPLRMHNSKLRVTISV